MKQLETFLAFFTFLRRRKKERLKLLTLQNGFFKKQVLSSRLKRMSWTSVRKKVEDYLQSLLFGEVRRASRKKSAEKR